MTASLDVEKLREARLRRLAADLGRGRDDRFKFIIRDPNNATRLSADIIALLTALTSEREAREAAEQERDRLVEATGATVTLGGGLVVHGTVEAVRRVQDYILLDSSHPVEKEDVRRRLARALQAAEARLLAVEEESDLLYWALKRALGVVVEFGDLNGFRNLTDEELGRTVIGVAEAGAALLNKLDGLAFDPAKIPPRRARALLQPAPAEGEK
jgi:hypothetical protein